MPLKLTMANSSGPRSITLDEIPIGATFFGDHAEKNTLFLRMYGGVVSLDDPRNTWSYPTGMLRKITIENYRPVDIVGEVREI